MPGHDRRIRMSEHPRVFNTRSSPAPVALARTWRRATPTPTAHASHASQARARAMAMAMAWMVAVPTATARDGAAMTREVVG